MSDGNEISRVGDLVEYVSQRIGSECPSPVLWFRGHSSAQWDVSPAIWRDYDDAAERNFTNRFRSRASTRLQTVPEYTDSAYWLSLMQHYGLPTRLLDWTRSPLVAAYFAVQKYIYETVAEPEDACIWVLEPHALNVSEGFENITPAIDAKMCGEMLTPAFTHRVDENNQVMAVMAAERDLRMFVQQGCFTIHSNREPLNQRRGREKYLTQLVIPAQHVERMAFEVDVCGFRKGDIFPDLGHLADELKGIYAPRRHAL